MAQDVSRAAIFRQRAGEARTMAKAKMPEDQKQSLLSIAESYEQLAALVERVSHS